MENNKKMPSTLSKPTQEDPPTEWELRNQRSEHDLTAIRRLNSDPSGIPHFAEKDEFHAVQNNIWEEMLLSATSEVDLNTEINAMEWMFAKEERDRDQKLRQNNQTYPNAFIIPNKEVDRVPNKHQICYCHESFQYHQTSTNGEKSFRCTKYASIRCQCKIIVIPTSPPQYQLVRSHNHAPQSDIVSVLSDDRQIELERYCEVNHHERSNKVIADALNRNLTPSQLRDRRFYITHEHVKRVKKMHSTRRLESLLDIATREDLARTVDKQVFFRELHVLPGVFVIMFAAPWMVRLLRSVTENDQLFVDGTFSVVPAGIAQLVVIMASVGNARAEPVLFVWTQAKTKEEYLFVWKRVVDCAPGLSTIRIPITIDFEYAHIAAITTVLPKCTIVGCMFHFIQAVKRHVKKRITTFHHDIKNNPDGKQELLNDLRSLVLAANPVQFNTVATLFVPKWGQRRDGDSFISYMRSTWLTATSRFPPRLWCVGFHFRSDIERTNNAVERFNRELNQLWPKTSVKTIKECIYLLKEVEKRRSMEYSAQIFNEQPMQHVIRDSTALRPTPMLERHLAQRSMTQQDVLALPAPQPQVPPPQANIRVPSRAAREEATGIRKRPTGGRGRGGRGAARTINIPYTGELVFEN